MSFWSVLESAVHCYHETIKVFIATLEGFERKALGFGVRDYREVVAHSMQHTHLQAHQDSHASRPVSAHTIFIETMPKT